MVLVKLGCAIVEKPGAVNISGRNSDDRSMGIVVLTLVDVVCLKASNSVYDFAKFCLDVSFVQIG